MCGIAGIVRLGGTSPNDSATIKAMLASIGHRGPDGSGVLSSERAQIGAVRLAISDAARGSQPVSGCESSLNAVFNGEIYNHAQIRQRLNRSSHRLKGSSDSELIPHLYEDFGSSLVDHLRGMFAIALWDERKGVLLLARDRLGIKPLYYAHTRDSLIFASEIKAIFASGLIDARIDRQSLDDLFTLSYPCPPRTMFEGVRELLPAHVLELNVSSGAIRVRKYWECSFPYAGEHQRLDWAQASEELLNRLQVRVCDHLSSDVPVGMYLSGGLDSAVIAALVKDVTRSSPPAFSVAFDLDRFDETPAASDAAACLGSETFTFRCSSSIASEFEDMIWHTELPLQFPLALPLMGLSRLARESGYRVVMTGEGADEIFGGYDCFRADKMRRMFDRPGLRFLRPAAYRELYKWHKIPQGTVSRMIENLEHQAQVRDAFGGIWPPWYDMWTTIGLDRDRLLGVDSRVTRPVWESPDGFNSLVPKDVARMDPHNAAIALELVTRLPSWILLIGDRASMANGVEARSPFLDHEIVEFVASLDPSFKLRGFSEKAILRNVAARMLPDSIAKKPKRPFFTPIKEWFFEESAPDFVENALSKDSVIRSGMFDPDLVTQYRQQIRSVHDSSLLKHQLEWTLILILGAQILHRQFVEKPVAEMAW